MLSYFATYFGQFFLYVISFLSYPFIRVALFKIVDTHILEYVLSQSYIKRLIWYNLYDSQLAFKFLWRLHDHTICSYQVHKSCSYRLFILQELKQNDLKISCSSSKSRKKRKKKEKTQNFGTLPAELRLEEEYNYNILLRITFENFKEIYQLIKDNIPKENTNLRELIPHRLPLAATIGFLSTGELYKSYGYEYYCS